MANYEHSKDLKEEVLRHAGELTDGTSEFDETAMIFLNRAHHALLSGAADLGLDIGQPWPWAKKQYPSVLIIQPAIRTYTAETTNGSNQITFSANIAASMEGYHIAFGETSDLYRITSHVAGTDEARLDSIFLGDSGDAYATRLMKFDYTLDPGVLRLIGPLSVSRNLAYNASGKIELIDNTGFERDYPMAIREGVPDRATQVYKNNDMRPTIRFNRIPASTSKPIRVEYNYIPVPDDLTNSNSSIPLVPRDHRMTLAYYAAYYLLMNKNDNRAAEYRELARAGILALVRASKMEKAQTNSNYGRFIPRSDGGSFGQVRWGRDYD